MRSTCVVCLVLALILSLPLDDLSVAAEPVSTADSHGCCAGTTGNVNTAGIIDLTDLSMLVGYLTLSPRPTLPCPEEANVNGASGIDLTDLSMLVGYLTLSPRPTLPNCPSAGQLTYTQRLAVFTSVDSVHAVLNGVSPDSLATALVAFFGSRPEFEAAGKDGSTVWARFKDGRMYIISNNRFPGSSSGISPTSEYQQPDSVIPKGLVLPTRRFASWDEALRAAEARTRVAEPAYEIPSSTDARVIATLGSPCFTTGVAKARTLLASAGYQLSSSDGTVPGLLAVQGDGLFYIDAHCGRGTDRAGNPGVGAIWTNSLVSAAGDSAYASLLDSAELVYMGATDDKDGVCLLHRRYAFTGKFVAQYMSFESNSFILINACTSDNTTIKDGFRAAGASVYAGWTKPVTDDPANIAGEYLLDRMLGANNSSLTIKENPPQRPFDITQIWDEMKTFGLDTDPSNASKLIVTELQDDFELLAPSIATVFVHPYDQKLWLYGMFGSWPDDCQVTVGGVTLAIQDWGYSSGLGMDTIVCTIPDDGAGSAGDVQVTVRGIKSNIAQLSRYKGKFTLTHETGDGRKYVVTLDLQFRVHLGSFRTEPGKPPIYNQPTYVIHADMASTGVDTCSGVTAFPDGSTVTWSGTGELHNNIDGAEDPRSFIAGAWFDPENLKMQVYLSGGIENGITQTFRDSDGGTYVMNQSIIYGLDEFDGKHENFPPYVEIPLNPNFSISQGNRTASKVMMWYSMLLPMADVVKIKWDNITCEYPPDPEAERVAPLNGADHAAHPVLTPGGN